MVSIGARIITPISPCWLTVSLHFILSLLIALEDKNEKELISDIYEVEEILKDEGFNECDHLVLTSFVLAKYGKNKNKHIVAKKMKEVFILLKEKYYNIPTILA